MKEYIKDKGRIIRVLSVGLTLLALAAYTGASAQDGEKLFKANCSACHKVDANMVGPALKGVEERWAGKEALLKEWIKNPAVVKEKGDPYVKKLLAEWEPKSGLMNAQAVNDSEIDAILGYIKDWKPAAAAPGDKVAVPGAVPVDAPGVSTTWLFIIAFILLILLFSLWGVRSSLGRVNTSMMDARGEAHAAELSTADRIKLWLWKNKVFASVIGILVVVYLAVAGYEGLMGIGVYTGYTPEQPIKFNHMLHAGKNQVACVYCHTGALKGKSAWIPSANICMNCHTGINEGQNKEGTAEIAKIYDAVGWDLESRSYTGEEKPIKWVKVHNLPDHVYFNHAQHYVVGQIQCQECHGQIQEEYVVAGQHSELTMGWCINCHNQTEVVMEGNGYYDEVQERLVNHGKEELKNYLEDGSITAKELGGWECSKCHY